MRTATLSLLIPLMIPLLSQAATQANTRIQISERVSAAQLTAKQAAACLPAQPFYWEIGNGERMLAHGQSGANAPTGQTELALASASKWLYAAFVAERRRGALTEQDTRFLSFQSGYTRFRMCLPGQTVASCQSSLLNRRGRIDNSTTGLFDYNGGHMQQHATLMGLGSLSNEGLAATIKLALREVGGAWSLSYSQPQLAGGGVSNASDYGRFLRGMMKGDLEMGALLGSHPVCTNPQTCPSEAISTPIPLSESWQYSVGHWIESDPQVGDGSFSSPGAFGFYPWIDASKTFYGILARDARDARNTSDRNASAEDTTDKPAMQSVNCGRLIRAAWMTGLPQP